MINNVIQWMAPAAAITITGDLAYIPCLKNLIISTIVAVLKWIVDTQDRMDRETVIINDKTRALLCCNHPNNSADKIYHILFSDHTGDKVRFTSSTTAF
jgi:hypothetical protein